MARFRTRARAVDMLGRQQIAGIPTAISELFKNAHDAYADRVEVDYYRSDRLFVLRDDGVGMTKEDFESRWLTIGTESKVGGRAGLNPPSPPAGKAPRQVLGEKGIGRLAIAAIGPQLLILTRACRAGQLGDTVASYIHWRIFEMPGIDLDEIEIPVRTYSGGRLPKQNDVEEMLKVFAQNIERFREIIGDAEADRFYEDFSSIRVDPSVIDGYASGLSLAEDSGTHFIILPAHEIIEADLDESDADKASNLEKFLLGFTNTMTPGHPAPLIRTAFRDHRTEETATDLVDEERFFTPREFENADHHVRGRFDEYGQFIGDVTVYGEAYSGHIVPWPRAQGRKTLCGPFQIHLANVQGAARESTLPLDEHAALINKMNRFGGLYIYRDGIRILPYGDTDYDWLEIEKRRTLKASYYFFSYRRIFGVIELSRDHNADLSEKAGREGFRENRAYRQFRDILKHFFVQIAADFFREEGAFAERYEERKGEINRLELARRRREQLVTERRVQLARSLEDFFAAVDAGMPQQQADFLAADVRKELNAALLIPDPNAAAKRLLDIEVTSRRRLRDLEERYRITKPRGVGLNQRLQKDFDDHLAEFSRLLEGTFHEVRELVEKEVGTVAENARLQIDRRVRIERALQEITDQARRTARAERTETGAALDSVRSRVQDAARESIAEVEGTIKSVLAEFASLDVTVLAEADAFELRDQLEHRILEVKEREQAFLRGVRAQLEAIDLGSEGGQLDQIEALEQRNLTLEERADYDLQLAQLGMAIEVINHEFDSSIRAIREDLRRLKAWADSNADLQPLYRGLRNSFEHLDGYLTLFTPLHRRLYRQEVEIPGTDIHTYLSDLFRRRFERHEVRLEATEEFLGTVIVGYPSSFYPAFVNLIDNAVFWLRDQPQPRIIQLDALGSTMLVSNSGAAIPERRWKTIFEQGVSYKPGGRGLGLYIAREALRRVGYDLGVIPPVSGMNVTFQITPTLVSESHS